MAEKTIRLDVDNKHYLETISLMQDEIEALDVQRAEKAALEQQNTKYRQQLQEVTELITHLVRKDTKLIDIVQKQSRCCAERHVAIPWLWTLKLEGQGLNQICLAFFFPFQQH